MKRARCLPALLPVCLCALLLCGCSAPAVLRQVFAPDSIAEEKAAPPLVRDFLGMTKQEVTAALGDVRQQTYYGGAMVFQLAGADMWFWFGSDTETFDDVPPDARCVFVMAPLRDAAQFHETSVNGDALSRTLGVSFGAPQFDAHDGTYVYTAVQDGVQCTVSCNDDGTADTETDYIIYQLASD